MSTKRTSAERRDRYIAEGRCPICSHKKTPEETTINCRACLDRVRARQRAAYEEDRAASDKPRFSCGNCGVVGHNARGCPEPKKPKKVPTKVCAKCREPGHNRKTCPRVLAERLPKWH